MYSEKYGMSSWNAGSAMKGLPEGHKRCSQQVDPRCKEAGGVHPLSNYYRGPRPGSYRGECKFCNSYRSYQRTRQPDRIETYRKYQRDYKRESRNVPINSKPVMVLVDPTGMFKKGAEFSKHDFEESLAGGVWPRGMEVLDVDSGIVYIILGTRKIKKEDQGTQND